MNEKLNELKNNQQIKFLLLQIGEKLKDKRIQSKKKIDNISKKIKIKTHYLQSIENGELTFFANYIYHKSFIKLYASCLDIDVDNDLRMIDKIIENSNPVKKKDEEFFHLDYKPNIKLIFTVCLLIIALILFKGQIIQDKLSFYEFKKNHNLHHTSIFIHYDLYL